VDTLTAPARAGTVFHTLAVSRIERLCDDAVAVSFEVPPGLADAFVFHAGQSVVLRRIIEGREHRRNYSICSAPGQGLRIGVRSIPDGIFSEWLVDEVRPGDVIDVQTPSGRFGAETFGAERHLAIAAGSGITPILSIVHAALAAPGSVLTLLYGNRTSTSVMFVDELADLKDVYGSRLELVHVLSREPRDVELFSGRMDAGKLRKLLTEFVDAGALDHVWLCGPLDLIGDAREVLEERGVPADKVHFELFYVDEPPPAVTRLATAPGDTCALTVTIDGRTTTAQVDFDERLLDSAQRTRADLPFACKGGVCGTCRARVTAGQAVMMRNYALEPDEVERGFVLSCQAMPLTAEVTLDYDE
jgi:ring-1,2-phenylacetyl-CoA epoxidase subunit PaaE